jgi:hypothetical protein
MIACIQACCNEGLPAGYSGEMRNASLQSILSNEHCEDAQSRPRDRLHFKGPALAVSDDQDILRFFGRDHCFQGAINLGAAAGRLKLFDQSLAVRSRRFTDETYVGIEFPQPRGLGAGAAQSVEHLPGVQLEDRPSRGCRPKSGGGPGRMPEAVVAGIDGFANSQRGFVAQRNGQQECPPIGMFTLEYLLVGGYAVGHHGYPRYTADIDVWVPIDMGNAERLTTVLRDFGFDMPEVNPELFLRERMIIRMASRQCGSRSPTTSTA